jgi:hypothetical protein
VDEVGDLEPEERQQSGRRYPERLLRLDVEFEPPSDAAETPAFIDTGIVAMSRPKLHGRKSR